jgi:hypothetical protein
MTRFAESLLDSGHFLYGPDYPDYSTDLSVNDVIEKFGRFDGVLAMEQKFIGWLPPLNAVKLPKILLATDYFKLGNRESMLNRRLKWDEYNLILFQTMPEVDLFREHYKDNIKHVYFPMSVDLGLFLDLCWPRPIDVGAMWNAREDFYPIRPQIKEILLSIPKVTVYTTIERDCFSYVAQLNKCKLFVNGNSIFGNIQSRFTEVPATGGLLITNSCQPDLDAQGWADGRNIVLYKGLSDMAERVSYYLTHGAERSEIIANAKALVAQAHSNEVRVKQLVELFKSI